MVKGSCVCGAVEFEIDGAPEVFQYCHCSRCRKFSGSAHAANMFVPHGKLRFVRGEGAVKRYELPTAKYWCSAFCTTCGSAMPWLSKTGTRYIVPAGTLDADPTARPSRNVHFGSRAPWYVHAASLENHDGNP
jgi:hypothetical protein